MVERKDRTAFSSFGDERGDFLRVLYPLIFFSLVILSCRLQEQ